MQKAASVVDASDTITHKPRTLHDNHKWTAERPAGQGTQSPLSDCGDGGTVHSEIIQTPRLFPQFVKLQPYFKMD